MKKLIVMTTIGIATFVGCSNGSKDAVIDETEYSKALAEWNEMSSETHEMLCNLNKNVNDLIGNENVVTAKDKVLKENC